MAVLTEGLESAFTRFGGVPNELLFDQMRAVVVSDQRVGGGASVLNTEFVRFAAHWGCHPRACRPYRAQTKGKVERPIRYIRDSFFYGRVFVNDEDLNEQASRWAESTANMRQHRTTGERPVDHFERDEREALRPLASCPYRRLVQVVISRQDMGAQRSQATLELLHSVRYGADSELDRDFSSRLWTISGVRIGRLTRVTFGLSVTP